MGMADPNSGAVWGDCWRIPGGGVDEGENPEDALVREMKEELGIDVSNTHIELLEWRGHGKTEKTLKETGEKVIADMTFLVYKIQLDVPAGEVVFNFDPHEIAEYRWSDPSELPNLKLTPPSIELFTHLGYL